MLVSVIFIYGTRGKGERKSIYLRNCIDEL
jgi:hypothetical protein